MDAQVVNQRFAQTIWESFKIQSQGIIFCSTTHHATTGNWSRTSQRGKAASGKVFGEMCGRRAVQEKDEK